VASPTSAKQAKWHDLKGTLTVRGVNGIRKSLESLMNSYGGGKDIGGSIFINPKHSYWWILEYGSGQFFGEKKMGGESGEPELGAPQNRFLNMFRFTSKSGRRWDPKLLARKRVAVAIARGAMRYKRGTPEWEARHEARVKAASFKAKK
jgi:hypothetical protein